MKKELTLDETKMIFGGAGTEEDDDEEEFEFWDKVKWIYRPEYGTGRIVDARNQDMPGVVFWKWFGYIPCTDLKKVQ